MKHTVFSAIVGLTVLFGPPAFSKELLTGVQINEALDGKTFKAVPAAMAEWNAVWRFDLNSGKSKILSIPKGGNATYKTVIKGDQVCNVGGVPGLHKAHGFGGCFTVVKKGKSLLFMKGKRRIFTLRE